MVKYDNVSQGYDVDVQMALAAETLTLIAIETMRLSAMRTGPGQNK